MPLVFYLFASKENNTIGVPRKKLSLLERIKTPMYTLQLTLRDLGGIWP